jgi:hypothetical protein
MLTIGTCFWDATEESQDFSRCYSEAWVEKLYRGFKRHLTVPFRFVCFVDRLRQFKEPIEQELLTHRPIGYGSCVEPFKLNAPMIFVGLDTIIVRNIDKLARWCLEHPGEMALPKHPFEDFSINGVVLWGGENADVWDNWQGQNDMKWMRSFPHSRIDELFTDQVVSYRAHVKGKALNKARIIYFHGRQKPHELPHEAFVKEHWR